MEVIELYSYHILYSILVWALIGYLVLWPNPDPGVFFKKG